MVLTIRLTSMISTYSSLISSHFFIISQRFGMTKNTRDTTDKSSILKECVFYWYKSDIKTVIRINKRTDKILGSREQNLFNKTMKNS